MIVGMKKYLKKAENNFIWITNIYWKLEDISCVLVPRNKIWFNYTLPYFKSAWETIVKKKEKQVHLIVLLKKK